MKAVAGWYRVGFVLSLLAIVVILLYRVENQTRPHDVYERLRQHDQEMMHRIRSIENTLNEIKERQ